MKASKIKNIHFPNRRSLQTSRKRKAEVGDTVRIGVQGIEFEGCEGFVVSRNGAYYYIRPKYYKHQIELFRHEFTLLRKKA